MPYQKWPDVFALVVKITAEIKKKNPSMAQKDAVKKAYKDSRYLAAKAEFDAYKAKHPKK